MLGVSKSGEEATGDSLIVELNESHIMASAAVS